MENIKDLSILNFARVLLNYPEIHNIVIPVEGEEDCEVVGTYNQLIKTFNELDNRCLKQSLLDTLNRLPNIDYYAQLSDLDIYDYLEEKTRGFTYDRVKIVLNELERFYLMDYKEDSLSENRDNFDEWDFHTATSILKRKLKEVAKGVTPSVPVQPSPDPTNEVDYKSLMGFINGSIVDIAYIMEHKTPQDGVKLRWLGEKGDAMLLLDVLQWSISDIDKCFSFKGGKPFVQSNRKKNGGESVYLRKVLLKIKG